MIEEDRSKRLGNARIEGVIQLFRRHRTWKELKTSIPQIESQLQLQAYDVGLLSLSLPDSYFGSELSIELLERSFAQLASERILDDTYYSLGIHICYRLSYRGEYSRAIEIATCLVACLRNSRGDGILYRLARLCFLLGMRNYGSHCLDEYMMATKSLHDRSICVRFGDLLYLSGNIRKASCIYRLVQRRSQDRDRLYSHAKMSEGLCNLLSGSDRLVDHERYEERYRFSKNAYSNIQEWRGEQNGTLLLYRDQGLGDEIFFLRFARVLCSRLNNLRICLHVSARLKSVASGWFPNALVFSDGDTSEDLTIDYALRLSSLPTYMRRYGIQLHQRSITSLLECSRHKIAKKEKRLRLGILWRSSHNQFGYSKSLPLEDFIRRITEASNSNKIVSFQHDQTVLESSLCDKYSVERGYLGWPNEDLSKVADRLRTCDAYIGISGSMAHMAASVGLQCHVITPLIPTSFAWSTNRVGNAVWYPENVHIYKSDAYTDRIESVEKAASILSEQN